MPQTCRFSAVPAHFSALCLSFALVLAAACGDGGRGGDDDDMPDAGAGPVCGNGSKEAGEECDDGNTIDGDGCEASCVTTPTQEIQCETLAPLAAGVCEVTAGDASKLIKGDVLTPGKIYLGGQVAVDAAGVITCVGCDCAAGAAAATVITCPQGVISPGLINTHDHITFTQNSPYTDTGERYEHRHDWRRGQRGHSEINSAGSASGDQVRWGELRFVMGGATSIVGSGSASGFLRNLDRADQEGLGQPQVAFQTFPLGDSNGMQLASGCTYPGGDTAASIANEDAYLPHVSEGIDGVSRNEFVCTSSSSGGGQDLVVPQTAMIHGVGLRAGDYAAMATDGTALIWSPRSNITLYGDTAQVTLADRLGVQIALGTDWMPTGSMSLLRELRCADELNTTYLDGYFSDEDLWKMVTVNAAAVTATDDVIGVLAAGKVADIAIFDGRTSTRFRAVLAAEPKDVTLVLRGGKALYGDDAVVEALASTCDVVDVCTVSKRVCSKTETGKTYAELEASAGAAIYDAFYCGTPDKEPSCLPERPMAVNGSTIYTGIVSDSDDDGDGIDDAADNCPTVFNPVRPLDDGLQANTDGDTEGDACDACPLDADTATCTVFNPDDSDGDGVLNVNDNCPGDANPGQEDGDTDGKGDLCDACPEQANPGGAGCTVSIYSIKDGTTPLGSAVAVTNALVTGRTANGFFVQVREGDVGYDGADFSGVFVFQQVNTVAVGDRVNITAATVADFFGEIQLSNVTVAVTSSGNPGPAPIVVEPAQVTTGGARAAALEGVLVKVETVQVASLDVAFNEFIVDSALRVDDMLFLTTPFPAVGQNFASITGVLAFRNSNSKLEPRGAADLVPGEASLTGFAPASSFARVGQSGAATFPTALTVTLSNASETATFVAVTSSDAALTVAGGGVTIPAGQTSAPVLVTGVAQAASVTLTATLGAGAPRTASVRVLGAAETPVLAALAPAIATTLPGGTVQLTVTLDIPAGPGGQAVALAATAGTVPANVTVAADATTATFAFVAGNGTGDAVVTATLGGSFMATITVATVIGGLVINEVDYDQPSTDTLEFVEIYNGTGGPVNLTGKSLVLINGSNGGGAVYTTMDLGPAGTLPAGGYLVVGSAALLATMPAGAAKITLDGAIQNGDPDGLALIDTTTNMFIDKLSYGGAITTALIPGVGSGLSLVETAATTVKDTGAAPGSMVRSPNGSDTNNSSTDWAFTSTTTPGRLISRECASTI